MADGAPTNGHPSRLPPPLPQRQPSGPSGVFWFFILLIVGMGASAFYGDPLGITKGPPPRTRPIDDAPARVSE